MLTLDIVMQGPIWSKTYETAEAYVALDFVNKVYISTWADQSIQSNNDRIEIILSPKLPNPGRGNRNNQIYSTRVGLDRCTADLAMKTRTDQNIYAASMQKMHKYFETHNAIDKKFLDGSGPKGAIFTIGLYSGYVFHPQDHLYYGYREDMQKLFSLPLEDKVPDNLNDAKEYSGARFTHEDSRANAYIGMHYYALFDERIQYMVKNYQEFVVDLAVHKAEAFEREALYKDIIFKAFPPIDLWWEKFQKEYPYAEGKGYSEYCGNEW